MYTQIIIINILWFHECLDVIPADKTIKLVHILFRHGIRNPLRLETYKKDPYRNFSWPDGYGALTNIGKKQLYILGKNAHKRYIRLLRRGNFETSRILARSSEYDRCFMSAAAFLLGFIPPTGENDWNPDLYWSNVPVHILLKKYDYLIQLDAPCPAYDTERLKYLQSDEVLRRERKNSGLYSDLQRRTGNKITESLHVHHLFGTLMVHEDLGLKLPEWSWKYYPKKLRTYSNYIFKSNTSTTLMKRLKAGFLIKEFIDVMRESEKNEMNSKDIYLYSGHDKTIAALLNSLGIFGDLIPLYGAAVVIEGHVTSIGKIEIRLFYYKTYEMENPIEWYIPGCTPPCLLDDFVMIYDEIIPKQSIEIECSVKEEKKVNEPRDCNICLEQSSIC